MIPIPLNKTKSNGSYDRYDRVSYRSNASRKSSVRSLVNSEG